MAFSTIPSFLISDSYSNLYNFIVNNDELVLIYFDKLLKKVEKKNIVENCTLEFDATIDNDDNLYLVCSKKDGNFLLLSLINNEWETINVEEMKGKSVFNLNITVLDNKIHIFYCSPLKDKDNVYSLYHHIYDGIDWSVTEICDIKKKEVLNPISVINDNDKIFIAYYDLVDNIEQIFLKAYDNSSRKWNDAIQLTHSNTSKLFIDMLFDSENELYVTYSEYKEGNLVVKFEKYEITEDAVKRTTEHILSNTGNCSYPTIINYDNRLWNVWTEYDNILSCYSDNRGFTWSNPYIWRKAKGSDFIRYKYLTNDIKIKENYKLNYSFGKTYPDISFIGFGPLEDVIEVPLKDKAENNVTSKKNNIATDDISKTKTETVKKDKTNNNIEQLKVKLEEIDNRLKKIEKFYNQLYEPKDMKKIQEGAKKLENLFMEVDEIKRTVEKLSKIIEGENIKNIEERLDEIENYLNRRRRPLFTPR